MAMAASVAATAAQENQYRARSRASIAASVSAPATPLATSRHTMARPTVVLINAASGAVDPVRCSRPSSKAPAIATRQPALANAVEERPPYPAIGATAPPRAHMSPTRNNHRASISSLDAIGSEVDRAALVGAIRTPNAYAPAVA